jgi:hypothetical protein
LRPNYPAQQTQIRKWDLDRLDHAGASIDLDGSGGGAPKRAAGMRSDHSFTQN